MQCSAVWCSVVQCGAVWCSMAQCSAVWYSVVRCGAVWCSMLRVLLCVAVRCNVLQCPTHRPTIATSDSWISHVAHMNESCLTYEGVMSHIPLQRATSPLDTPKRNKACHTYRRVMSHIRMSRVVHMNKSCHKYFCKERLFSWAMGMLQKDASCHTHR